MATASIIIPTRNIKSTVETLLESIFSQEYHGDIQVLIMDSSDDRTVEIARQFPGSFFLSLLVMPEDSSRRMEYSTSSD
jgi:glycosyltransferase involved in cell wall biosynthesis